MGQFTIKLFPTQNWSDDPENKGKNLDYTGYYLIANYNQQLYGNTIMGRTRVDFDESGYGILSLPENDQIQNKELSIEIYGSSGNVVRQRFNRTSNSFYDDKDKVIEITVEPEDLIEVDETPKKYKVFGRLIELSNCRDLANLQIVFFGNNTEETPTLQNSTILGVNKTFKDGYFQVEIPIDPQFRKYYAAIEHSNIDFYPLVTFSDNDKMFIQDKQIISVSFNAEENKTEEDKNNGSTDCGCHKQNDRLPSQVEFGNSNNKYSQDLGGQCVNFTVPNRTIDEFSFYHVVRTTEPEIKSVTISNAEILKIYERLVADLIKIPPKLLLTSVPLNAVFKDVTVFKNEIQRASSSSTPSRTTRATSTTSTVLSRVPTSTIRTAIPTIKYSINDFRGLESVSFSELHEKVKNNSKLEFDSKKQKLEEEEANIIQLIERVKESLESIRLNLDSPESLGKFNDLKYQLDIIKIAIGKYIESCENFKEFFNDELNKKLLLPSELDYLKELDKTIEQFEIFEKSINNTLQQLIQTYIVRHPGRKNVSIENEIDWDSDPTIFHNTTIAHGHLLHFKQIWKNDGYSIGRVLQSIPLMPGQQKNIAVMEWNRTNVSSRLEDQTTSEQLTNNMSRDRDVSEVMESAFSENIRASSQVKSKTSGWSVGASVGFPIGPVMVGISGGYSSSKSSASSSASQDASRNLSANSMNKLRDNINQSATSMRSQRSTVIQTVSQNESFSITTEVIANYNHCHALTMQYFEILRHIVIEQKLADVQECLFVPLPMSVFDENKILRWRNTLSGVLLQPDLQEGLNAVDRMVNKYKFVDFPEGRYADENIDYIEGEMTISFNFVRPLDKLDAEGKENFEALQTKLESNPFFKIYGLFNTVLNNYKQVAFNLQKERDAIFENEIVPKIVDGLVNCLVIENSGVTIPGIDFTLIDTYENKRISGWDALFKYANQGKFSEISSKNKPLRIKFKTTLPPGIKRSNLNSLEIRFDLNNIGLGSISEFPSENRIILHSMNAKYATQHYNGTLLSNYNIKDDIKPGTTDKASVRTPLNANEKKNPKFEDAVLTAKLISHLNEYLEYYHKQIWLNMDPNRLFSLVDGFIAPHSGGKSVASVCDNQIIGVVGNNLVLKVAPGYKLDPTYNLTEAGNLLEHYQPTTPPDPFRICFPTNGIYAEAVMGACNSCEKIDDTRYWKWEEHPIPNRPTEIQPINTDSRYVEPGNLQTKDLATPMINIQNAPEAPAPTGLSGVFDLMGKSGIFSDMSGLAGNQEIVKHALTENAKTLQNTQANAVEGMKVAKQIYDSQQANKDAQRKLDEIDKAFPPNGTPEQRAENSRLKSALFNKQIGLEDANSNGMSGEVGQAVNNLSKIDELVKSGKISKVDGEAMKSSIISEVANKTNGQNKPTLMDAAVKAIDQGKDVKAVLTEGEKLQSIDVNSTQQSNSAIIQTQFIDTNPNERTFNHPIDKSGILTLNVANAYASNSSYIYHWAIESDLIVSRQSGIDNEFNRPSTFSNTLKSIEIWAGKPGIYNVQLSLMKEKPNTLPIEHEYVDSQSVLIGVPQFVVVQIGNGTSLSGDRAYNISKTLEGVTNPKSFDDVLKRAKLHGRRDIVLFKVKAICDLLLKHINVRTIWHIPDSNGTLIENKDTLLSTLKTNNPSFESEFITNVRLNGYSNMDSEILFGITYNTSAHSYNEDIDIFPGDVILSSFLNTNAANNPNQFIRCVYKLSKQLDDAETNLIAAPADVNLQNEFNRLLDLWTEVFSRILGHTIAHEICHSLLGFAGGLNIGGHTSENPSNLLSDFPEELQEVTGMFIDNTKFPDVGSFTLPTGFLTKLIVESRLIGFAFYKNKSLKSKLEVSYATPPTPPFNE